jgi:hypothetical protein
MPFKGTSMKTDQDRVEANGQYAKLQTGLLLCFPVREPLIRSWRKHRVRQKSSRRKAKSCSVQGSESSFNPTNVPLYSDPDFIYIGRYQPTIIDTTRMVHIHQEFKSSFLVLIRAASVLHLHLDVGFWNFDIAHAQTGFHDVATYHWANALWCTR